MWSIICGSPIDIIVNLINHERGYQEVPRGTKEDIRKEDTGKVEIAAAKKLFNLEKWLRLSRSLATPGLKLKKRFEVFFHLEIVTLDW